MANKHITPAEERVLRELLNGLSNKEIADKLHISCRTVKFHLEHIYPKLNIRGRGDLLRRKVEIIRTTNLLSLYTALN